MRLGILNIIYIQVSVLTATCILNLCTKLEAELKAFNAVLDNPQRPLLAILGGAKIADKIPLINNLLEKDEKIILGGGMA